MVDGGLGDAHDSSTWLSAATRWARREQITSVRIEPDAVLSSQLQIGCRITVAELGVITNAPYFFVSTEVRAAEHPPARVPCFAPPSVFYNPRDADHFAAAASPVLRGLPAWQRD